MDKKGKRKLVHAITIRIALPALLTILLFVTAIFLIILPSLKENLLAKKRELLLEVTKITWDMVAAYEKMERAGVLKSMLRHTHRYRASQLFEYLDALAEPAGPHVVDHALRRIENLPLLFAPRAAGGDRVEHRHQ